MSKNYTYGSTERVINSSGQPRKLGERTDKICTVCEFSAGGATNLRITSRTGEGVTLSCPNCGDSFGTYAQDVKVIPEDD